MRALDPKMIFEGSAIEESCDFPWRCEPDIRLVNVSYVSGFFDLENRENAQRTIQNAADAIRHVAPNAKGVWLENDHIGEALVSYIEEQNIDIVFMGETPRTRLGRMVMGSMSLFVLRHAPCAVWIARNQTQQDCARNSKSREIASS